MSAEEKSAHSRANLEVRVIDPKANPNHPALRDTTAHGRIQERGLYAKRVSLIRPNITHRPKSQTWKRKATYARNSLLGSMIKASSFWYVLHVIFFISRLFLGSS